MNDYLSEVFGDGGLFASRFPGYEMREGQVALARMVDEAMRGGRHALGEGPCGTGKSVAYAVPAVHHAHHEKKRVVIATANIALQEQLVRKDLPMLASVLPWPFTFALLEGRNKYVCLDRMADHERAARGHGDRPHRRRVRDALQAPARARRPRRATSWSSISTRPTAAASDAVRGGRRAPPPRDRARGVQDGTATRRRPRRGA